MEGKATVLAILLVAGLASLPVSAGRLEVLTTTTIVGDVVHAIGGDRIELRVLFPPDADPHAFQPTPRDVVTISEADVVFQAGAGLEAGMRDLLESSSGRWVDLSEWVALRGTEDHADDSEAVDPEDGENDHHHHPGDVDPHVWFDPTQVALWTKAIEETLMSLDPDGAAIYRANAEAYRRVLEELDRWILDRTSSLPDDRRRLVTDHLAFGYFADRYGFEQIGSVFPGFSTLTEPSARDVAELIETIEVFDVPAIFVGTSSDPTLARIIATDTRIRVVTLYVGSLSGDDGPAASYVDFMRYDVDQIVNALSP